MPHKIRFGWSQQKLAGEVGVTDGTISLLETMKSVPNVLLVALVAHAFGVTLDYLVLGKEKLTCTTQHKTK